MFKSWRRSSNKTSSYEPKTPKMPSVSLPDERYIPIESHIAYMEKPPRGHSLMRRPNHEHTGPMLDAWAPHPDARSRSRTISTPVRDVHAPRPIRPHPSQGGYIPVMDANDRMRRDHSRGSRAPAGVPSLAYFEEQVQRAYPETRAAPQPHNPIDMQSEAERFRFPASEYERLQEVARRTGARIHMHPSKAALDEMNEQKRQTNRSRNSIAPSIKKEHSRSQVENRNEKEIVDFEDWKAVPLELEDQPVPVNPDAPLKSALKKAPSQKGPTPTPGLKSAMKKTEPVQEPKLLREEIEANRARHGLDKRYKMRVTSAPSKAYVDEQNSKSKAFLEAQKEVLARREPEIKHKGLASYHPSQSRQDNRASAYSNNNSSSTGSPTDSITAGYEQRVHSSRSRRPSVSEPPSFASSYIPAYIKKTPNSFIDPHLVPEVSPIHGALSWPLIEHAARRFDGYPPVIFDAGFDPRVRPVKVRVQYHPTPMSREDETIPVLKGMHLTEMVILCPQLRSWPIHLRVHPHQPLRVIDVFRAIYHTYSQPLTAQELTFFREEDIHRCRPAFMQRCQDSSDFVHNEEKKGLLRIDLLCGNRIFKGLRPVPGQPWTYNLFFETG